jgi:hypothetical protein
MSIKGWHGLLLTIVVGALILLGPHFWKFYVNPKDTLEETVAACHNEADRLFGVEVAREEAARPIPRSVLGQTPAGLQRDSFVEDCITKQGWCVIFSKLAPATLAGSFLPSDRLAARLYVYRYLGYPASCEPPGSPGE